MSSVKTLGQLLIDILGQHENQGLLNESKHVDYLDQAHPVIRQRVSSKYQVAIQKYNDYLKFLILQINLEIWIIFNLE